MVDVAAALIELPLQARSSYGTAGDEHVTLLIVHDGAADLRWWRPAAPVQAWSDWRQWMCEPPLTS